MDFRITLPIPLVLASYGWDWLSKKMYIRTYLDSHLLWHKRHRVCSHWESIGNGIEYSTQFALVTGEGEDRISKIAVRALSQEFQQIELLFEAKSTTYTYQQHIKLFNISTQPIISSLTNIPPIDAYILPDLSGVVFNLESNQLYVLSGIASDGTQIGRQTGANCHFTHSWFLNSAWEKRWGSIWNLDAIKFTKDNIFRYWYRLDRMPNFRGPRSSIAYIISHVALIKPISILMQYPKLVSLQFWLLIWLRIYTLDKQNYEFRRSKRSTQNA